MTDPDARRARLVARHHLGRTATDAAAATRDLVCLHTSDPLTPHLALWARVDGYQTDALDDAIDGGDLWRLHAMRRTLWVAPSDEIGTLQAATGTALAAAERKRLTGWIAEARPDVEAWLAGLEAQVLDAVRERPGVATRALTAAIPELATKVILGSGKWQTEMAIASRLLTVLAMELKLARTRSAGSWKASQYGWVLPGQVAPVAPAAARARLVARYVARFGPVTTTDIRWWTGLTAAHVTRALHDAGAESIGEHWILRSSDDTPSAQASGVALLPGLDPTAMGYKERAWYLGDHEAALFDRNGNVGPTVWVDGRIVGGWAVGPDGSVRHRLLEDVGAAAEAAVSREAGRLTEWLGGTAITPRFRTPLERELS